MVDDDDEPPHLPPEALDEVLDEIARVAVEHRCTKKQGARPTQLVTLFYIFENVTLGMQRLTLVNVRDLLSALRSLPPSRFRLRLTAMLMATAPSVAFLVTRCPAFAAFVLLMTQAALTQDLGVP